MKKILVVGLLLLSVFAFAQEGVTTLLIGKWNVQGNLPSQSVDFANDGKCTFTMRDGKTVEYYFGFDGGYLFIGNSGYSYELKNSNSKLILTPAFGEGGCVVTLVRSK